MAAYNDVHCRGFPLWGRRADPPEKFRHTVIAAPRSKRRWRVNCRLRRSFQIWLSL